MICTRCRQEIVGKTFEWKGQRVCANCRADGGREKTATATEDVQCAKCGKSITDPDVPQIYAGNIVVCATCLGRLQRKTEEDAGVERQQEAEARANGVRNAVLERKRVEMSFEGLEIAGIILRGLGILAALAGAIAMVVAVAGAANGSPSVVAFAGAGASLVPGLLLWGMGEALGALREIAITARWQRTRSTP